MDNVLAIIQREIAAGYCPGCVAIAGNVRGETLAYVSGLAERVPERRAMQIDSIFEMASVTKVVATATAVALLIERGAFTLDSSVRKLLPDYAKFIPQDVLIRHLATHSSGFSVQRPVPGVNTGENALLEWLETTPTTAPGMRYQYACKNAVLLGLVVEKVSGQKLADFCRQNIFTPLGMSDTRFGPIEPSPRLVRFQDEDHGHVNDPPARAIGFPVGNAGLFSTAPDLVRFCRMLLGDGELEGVRVLKPESVSNLYSVHSPKDLACYGILWHNEPQPEPHKVRPAGLSKGVFGHLGWTGQSLWFDPVRKLFLIILTNRTHAERFSLWRPGQGENFPLESNLSRVRIGEAMLKAIL